MPITTLNMFFFVPFSILVFSVVAIGWIVSRKFVYLKKLDPDVLENVVSGQEGFWAGFFPELAVRINSSKVRQLRLNMLAEFEKFLRKLRLLSLKIDAATNHLINQVRKSVVHHEGMINVEAVARVEQEMEITNGTGGTRDLEEEHRLIIEIARNPKNPQLYKKLGNIYMKTGEWHDASESFKKVLEFEPEDEITQNKLARLLKKLEKLPV